MRENNIKVLVVTKQFCAEGGAGILTSFIVDALLKLGHQVRVLCYQADPSIKFRNFLGLDFSGSDLIIDEINNRVASICSKSGYLGSFYLMHLVRKKQFDDYVVISAWDEMDFGRAAIQYVHWVSHHPIAHNGNPALRNSIKRIFPILYRTVVCKTFGFNQERVKNNISIFNSQLTKEEFERHYGSNNGHIIYPPILIFEQFARPFEQRENGFVYSGRISPDKNVHLMIDSIKKLRESGFDLHFHVVGPASNSDYMNKLVNSYPHDWVIFEGSKNRSQLSEILGQHKYSIQGRHIEPFGMAAAEACKMGCLTFIPQRSGLAELIGEHTLIFKDFSDFREKFCQLQQSPQNQIHLSNELRGQFSDFSGEEFQNRFLSAVFGNNN